MFFSKHNNHGGCRYKDGILLGRVSLKGEISFKEELDGELETEKKSTFGSKIGYQKKSPTASDLHH